MVAPIEYNVDSHVWILLIVVNFLIVQYALVAIDVDLYFPFFLNIFTVFLNSSKWCPTTTMMQVIMPSQNQDPNWTFFSAEISTIVYHFERTISHKLKLYNFLKLSSWKHLAQIVLIKISNVPTVHIFMEFSRNLGKIVSPAENPGSAPIPVTISNYETLVWMGTWKSVQL